MKNLLKQNKFKLFFTLSAVIIAIILLQKNVSRITKI